MRKRRRQGQKDQCGADAEVQETVPWYWQLNVGECFGSTL